MNVKKSINLLTQQITFLPILFPIKLQKNIQTQTYFLKFINLKKKPVNCLKHFHKKIVVFNNALIEGTVA